jgi:hypothetical protein
MAAGIGIIFRGQTRPLLAEGADFATKTSEKCGA